ncbi:MAG: sulfatase, partial [Polyangiaceae bacterium]|nr:sulfatase [Polyangiaceae bacterium]
MTSRPPTYGFVRSPSKARRTLRAAVARFLFATVTVALLTAPSECGSEPRPVERTVTGAPPSPLAAERVDAGAGRSPSAVNPHASPAKHVVIFVADTLRADRVPPLADRRLRSPSLEAHAQGAMVFERAYAASNWTKPSVATLMTGVLPQEHRALTHNARLEESYVLIGERLQEAGFYTAGVVTNGYVSKNFGFGSGWDRMLHSVETSRSRGDLVAADVARVLRERPKDRPLFLYIHTTDVHAPYSPPRRDLAKYDARAYRGPIDFRRNRMLLQEIIDGIIPLGLRDRDRLVALYDGGVTYHDRQFARIRQALERSGILGEALVVFTSDHGEELFDHDSVSHGGYRLHEELVRVPLLVSGPGIEP